MVLISILHRGIIQFLQQLSLKLIVHCTHTLASDKRNRLCERRASGQGIVAPRKGCVRVNKNRSGILLTRPVQELGDVEEPRFGLDYVRIDDNVVLGGRHTLDDTEAGAVLAVCVSVRVQRSIALDVDSSTVCVVSMVWSAFEWLSYHTLWEGS